MEKRGGLPLVGLIWLFTSAIGNPVRKCMFPECREITVRSSEVRDVYVTGCYISKVTIIGDPKDVRIHAPNRLCDPFRVIDDRPNYSQSTQRGVVNEWTFTSTSGEELTNKDTLKKVHPKLRSRGSTTVPVPRGEKAIYEHHEVVEIHPKLTVPVRSQGSTTEDIYEHDEVIGFLSWAASVTAALILLCIRRYLSRGRRHCLCKKRNNNDVQEEIATQGEHIPMFPHTPPSEATTPSSACDSTLQPGSTNTSEITFTTCSSKPLLRPSSSLPELVNTHTAKRVLFNSPPTTQQESDAQRDLPVIQPTATSQPKILDTSSTSCAQTPLVDLPVSANTRSKTGKKVKVLK